MRYITLLVFVVFAACAGEAENKGATQPKPAKVTAAAGTTSPKPKKLKTVKLIAQYYDGHNKEGVEVGVWDTHYTADWAVIEEVETGERHPCILGNFGKPGDTFSLDMNNAEECNQGQ